MITSEQLVSREVIYCVSSLVSTLANRPDDGPRFRNAAGDTLADLSWQAIELASPIDDWEEAATQEGWSGDESLATGPDDTTAPRLYFKEGEDGHIARDWQELCEDFDIEPYQRDVYEHWIVNDWLADRLAEKGEKVDKDFAGITVWARTTTGQLIAADSVIEAICADLNKTIE